MPSFSNILLIAWCGHCHRIDFPYVILYTWPWCC